GHQCRGCWRVLVLDLLLEQRHLSVHELHPNGDAQSGADIDGRQWIRHRTPDHGDDHGEQCQRGGHHGHCERCGLARPVGLMRYGAVSVPPWLPISHVPVSVPGVMMSWIGMSHVVVWSPPHHVAPWQTAMRPTVRLVTEPNAGHGAVP